MLGSPRNPKQFETPNCAQSNSDLFFAKDIDEPGYNKNVEDTKSNMAKTICGECVHRVECADWGLANELHGVWGGMTPQERKKVLRRRTRLSITPVLA